MPTPREDRTRVAQRAPRYHARAQRRVPCVRRPIEEVTPAAMSIHSCGCTLRRRSAGAGQPRGDAAGALRTRGAVSSRAVLGLAKRTVYSATKAGLLGLARTWALEFGAQGITVNVVAPGPIERDGDLRERRFRRTARRCPGSSSRSRCGVWACHRTWPARCSSSPIPDAGFVTGQTLFVCGGTSVGSIVADGRPRGHHDMSTTMLAQ